MTLYGIVLDKLAALGLESKQGISLLLLALVGGSAILFSWSLNGPKLPVPPWISWVWGHEKEVFMNPVGTAYGRWIDQLGLTFRIKAAFWAPDILVLSDPAGIAYILNKQIYNYHHSKVVRPRIARLMGKGLGWVEGEGEHRRMRRLVSPSLTPENLKSMQQEVFDSATRVVNDFVAHMQNPGVDGTVNNIVYWTNKAALNVIGRVAFQHDFDGGDSKEAERILAGRHRGSTEIAKYMGFLTLMLLRRFPILNHFPIPAIQAQSHAKLAIQDGVAHEFLKHDMSAIRESGKQRDLLSRLLVAFSDNKISKQELYEHIATFVVSGQETTALALAFSVYELARNPEAQRKLREEVDAQPPEPSYDELMTNFPYLEACLKETLRLYPGLPYMERVAMKNDVIPLSQPVRMSDGSERKELVVRAGQTVVIPIYSIHHLESIWGPDVNQFQPERWLKPLPEKAQMYPGWSNMLGFSDGPRQCVGMRLAMFEYKTILASMMRKFRFESVNDEITLKISSSLQPWVKGKELEGPQLPVKVFLL